MSGRKGMRKYPAEIKEKILAEYKRGASQCALSKKYKISRYAIQCWIGARPESDAIPKPRGRKPAKTLKSTNMKTNG